LSRKRRCGARDDAQTHRGGNCPGSRHSTLLRVAHDATRQVEAYAGGRECQANKRPRQSGERRKVRAPPEKSAPGAVANRRQRIETTDAHACTHIRKMLIYCEVGIHFPHVGPAASVGGWTKQGILRLELIIHGRFRSSTPGSATRRRAGTISGGYAGRTGLSALYAGRVASPGICPAVCCAAAPATGRYR